MGASSNGKKKIFYKNLIEKLKLIPNDQYVCTKCNFIPEITNLDYNTGVITFKCRTHGKIKEDIRDYFAKESNYLYINTKCDGYNETKLQKDNLSYIFNRFIENGKNLCENCSKGIKLKSIKINEMNNICYLHLEKFTKFCKKCNIHFCDKDSPNCGHNIENILNSKNEMFRKEIKMIKSKKNLLMKQNELNNFLIKFIDTLITTYEKHPSNYFNSMNIRNIANINFKLYKNDQFYYLSNNEKGKALIDKIDNLQKNLLDKLNRKLEMNLTGNEIKINLDGKKIGDLNLELLCSIYFRNLKEISLRNNDISNIESLINLKSELLEKLDLSGNQITNIKPLIYLSSTKLKVLDCSNNKINDINSLNDIINKNKQLEKINLNKNQISNVDILKKNLPLYIKEINLDDNNLLDKDLEDIKKLFIKDKDFIIYKTKEGAQNFRLFGEKFVDNNKENCRIKINDKESDLKKSYDFTEFDIKSGEIIKVNLIVINKIVDFSYMFYNCEELMSLDNNSLKTDNAKNMSFMFYKCISLINLDGLSEWKTDNVTNMNSMFEGCSLLENLEGIFKWKTNNINSITSMFDGCSSLNNLNGLSKWETSNIKEMNSTFKSCSSLSRLDGISKWKMNKVRSIMSMFEGCSKIENLDSLSEWETKNITNMNSLFKGCIGLTNLDGITKWNISNLENIISMFEGCSSLQNNNNLISKWNINMIKYNNDMFKGCIKLENSSKKKSLK